MDKITEQDLANRGVKGLPDVPGLTTEEMQRKLEEIAREILIPKVNELVEGLNNANSNLNTKLDKSGSDPLLINRNTAAVIEAYNNAAVVVAGNVPAIGFHNPGIEGAALYLQNGQLVLLLNNGDAYTLDKTYFTHVDV